ncbi:MAG: RNA methyltransferase [Bacteroidota bacterium]
MNLISGIDISEIKDPIEYLKNFVTAERYRRFLEVVQNRTRYLTVVLEDIFQPHNASAVLRTCDCFGIQDVHIIENQNKYEVNPDVALGSSKWLNLCKYNGSSDNTPACLTRLKEKGYRIVATTPHKDDYTPENLPLNQKTALVFGTELEGLTPAALAIADDYIRIPMCGFTESLNISVSVAILIHTLTCRLRESNIQWRLTAEEIEKIMVAWLHSTITKDRGAKK